MAEAVEALSATLAVDYHMHGHSRPCQRKALRPAALKAIRCCLRSSFMLRDRLFHCLLRARGETVGLGLVLAGSGL